MTALKKLKVCSVVGALAYAAYKLYIDVKPRKAFPVQNFSPEKFLGKWYELARIPQTLDRALLNTKMTFSYNPDNSVRVIRSGYTLDDETYIRRVGRAIFREGPKRGALRISFIGPFYTGYNVVAIDEAYRYALVIGRTTSEAWLLSREKTIPQEVEERYLRLAAYIGVNPHQFVWVTHR